MILFISPSAIIVIIDGGMSVARGRGANNWLVTNHERSVLFTNKSSRRAVGADCLAVRRASLLRGMSATWPRGQAEPVKYPLHNPTEPRLVIRHAMSTRSAVRTLSCRERDLWTLAPAQCVVKLRRRDHENAREVSKKSLDRPPSYRLDNIPSLSSSRCEGRRPLSRRHRRIRPAIRSASSTSA